jgi:hypothetical protein
VARPGIDPACACVGMYVCVREQVLFLLRINILFIQNYINEYRSDVLVRIKFTV